MRNTVRREQMKSWDKELKITLISKFKGLQTLNLTAFMRPIQIVLFSNYKYMIWLSWEFSPEILNI